MKESESLFDCLFDWTRPKPFLGPASAWPKPEDHPARNWLLPLEFAALSGGPFTQHLNQIIMSVGHQREASIAWLIHPQCYVHPAGRHEVEVELLREAAATWLKKTKPRTIYLTENLPGASTDECRRWLEPLIGRDVPFAFAKSVAATNWINSLFPQAAELSTFQLLVAKYRKEVPEAEILPWLGLRYLSGYLKRERQPKLALSVAIDWAKAQAYHSPQNEITEAASLKPSQVMLNPTLQTVKIPEQGRILVFYRSGDQLNEVAIDWQQAALIDEIGEGTRVAQSDLVELVQHETLTPAHQQAGLQPKGEYQIILDRLIKEGLVLRGR